MIQDTAPATANQGDLWFNTADKLFYVFKDGAWHKSFNNDFTDHIGAHITISSGTDSFGETMARFVTIDCKLDHENTSFYASSEEAREIAKALIRFADQIDFLDKSRR